MEDTKKEHDQYDI